MSVLPGNSASYGRPNNNNPTVYRQLHRQHPTSIPVQWRKTRQRQLQKSGYNRYAARRAVYGPSFVLPKVASSLRGQR